MADVAHALHRLHEEHDTSGTREATAIAAARRPTAAVASDPAPTTPATPVAHPPRRRRTGLLALAALLLAAIALGGYLLLDGNRDADPQARSSSTPSAKPSDDGSTAADAPTSEGSDDEPSDEASTPAEEATPEESVEPSSQPVAGGSKARFVEGYYGVLPDDTETGWSMLTPDYQAETSRDTYEGFWSGIDAVTVEDTRPAGSDAVDVTLTYTSGGGTQSEVRRVFLERGDDGFLISGSEIVG
jgi:hypothetical protein